MSATRGKRTYKKKSDNSDDEENENESVTCLPLYPPRNNIPALAELDERDMYLIEKSRQLQREFKTSEFYFSDAKLQNIEFEPYTKQSVNLIGYLKPYFSIFPEELCSQRKVTKKTKVTDLSYINVDMLEENEESNEEDEEEAHDPNAEDDIDLEDEGDYAYQHFDDDEDQVEEEGFDEPTL